MADINDFDLNTLLTDDVASNDDFTDLLNTVITATESGKPNGEYDDTPSKKEQTVPVPARTEIPLSVYSQALDQLKRSFKEGAELLDMLQNASPILEEAEVSLEEQQEEYTESVMLEAAFDSYAVGPYFESAKVKNKREIVKAINAIKKDARTPRTDKYGLQPFKVYDYDLATVDKTASTRAGTKVGFTIAHATLTSAFDPAGAAIMVIKSIIKNFIDVNITMSIANSLTAGKRNIFGKMALNKLREDKTIKTKLWQMVGSFYSKENEIDEAMSYYADLFKDQLGDLKLGYVKLKMTYETAERNYDGHCYLLTVDNKSGADGSIDVNVSDEDLESFGKKSKKTKDDDSESFGRKSKKSKKTEDDDDDSKKSEKSDKDDD